MIMTSDPRSGYWFVGGDTSQLYSAAAASYVPAPDANYQSWIAAGHTPGQVPTETVLWNYLTEVEVPPYKPITQVQMRAVLRNANLLDQVQSAIAAAPVATQDQWNYAPTISILHPLITQLATQLNLPWTQVQQLFIQAAQIV